MDLFQALWKLGSGPFLAWMGLHSHKTMGAVAVILGAGLVWWFAANPESFMNIIGGVVGKIIKWIGSKFNLG